ncbi:MAG TPA: CpsB/CapC family capsule biosynthesis tyrosine phosphatase [Chitinophagaceae bacterium]|jgi:tyrosine-protein phosphatase YwqE|nr:CpsB/CapC family capsule biosynthesis tyrosine phosphatase [Chitinophagaceae bacterium]
MFKLFSKSKPVHSDISFLKADMHSHLLPGIDDGSPDMATSLKLVKAMMELGYTKLITTPHILWEMYPNTREIILEKLELLRNAVQAEGLNVEINAAAEYFLDEHVEGLLKKNTPLLTISGNMVLVEFSMAYPSHSLKDILFDMQMQNYQPVIAHPERYAYLEQNKAFYDELKDIGCLFQLNLLSLGGYYGRSVQELAQYLVKKNYYDLVGTDLHNGRHLEALKNPTLISSLRKLFDTGKIRNPEL